LRVDVRSSDRRRTPSSIFQTSGSKNGPGFHLTPTVFCLGAGALSSAAVNKSLSNGSPSQLLLFQAPRADPFRPRALINNLPTPNIHSQRLSRLIGLPFFVSLGLTAANGDRLSDSNTTKGV
jgi:hypothetical protein